MNRAQWLERPLQYPPMEVHYGQIAERTVRRNCQSITQFATLTKVNRRSVYNWFNQKDLCPTIIYKIGKAINHDFSAEMPELFAPGDFPSKMTNTLPQPTAAPKPQIADVDWKNRYLELLDDYQTLLVAVNLNTREILETK